MSKTDTPSLLGSLPYTQLAPTLETSLRPVRQGIRVPAGRYSTYWSICCDCLAILPPQPRAAPPLKLVGCGAKAEVRPRCWLKLPLCAPHHARMTISAPCRTMIFADGAVHTASRARDPLAEGSVPRASRSHDLERVLRLQTTRRRPMRGMGAWPRPIAAVHWPTPISRSVEDVVVFTRGFSYQAISPVQGPWNSSLHLAFVCHWAPVSLSFLEWLAPPHLPTLSLPFVRVAPPPLTACLSIAQEQSAAAASEQRIRLFVGCPRTARPQASLQIQRQRD
ncbi:hypothetical protein PHYPSEUDO_011044 [Phytophthora pseudosyringae]|uniref:Uncharacterized protein n=1 Tax=Phytophthora pseudosyringae TaxID=221518 RepID=A0A8T1V901_9STRA|nr:hypothetical protein PHYPSEUDO_011044 [Phytophthora pseudosyringae]